MLKTSLRNKRGSTSIFGIIIITIAILFTALLVDFGLGFSARAQIRCIADAMAIGGASYGKQAFIGVSGKKTAIVDDKQAPTMANKILNENKKKLPPRVSITKVEFNPTRNIDGKTMNWRDQYYSGNFTVRVTGRYNTIFVARPFLGSKAQIPSLSYTTDSRVKVRPQ